MTSALFELGDSSASDAPRPLCEFHLAGACKRGSWCKNPHSDGRKGIQCQFAGSGQCRDGNNCQFMHSVASQFQPRGHGHLQTERSSSGSSHTAPPSAQGKGAIAEVLKDVLFQIDEGCEAYAFDCEFVRVEVKNRQGELIEQKVPVSVGIVDRHLETMLYCRIRIPRGAVVVDDSFARNASNIESNWALGLDLKSVTALIRQLVEPTNGAILVGWALANDMAALGFTDAAAEIESGQRAVSLHVNESLVSSVSYAPSQPLTCYVVELQDFYRSKALDQQVRLTEAFQHTFQHLLAAHDSVADARMTMELFLHWEQSHIKRSRVHLAPEAPRDHPLLEVQGPQKVAEIATLQRQGYTLEVLEERRQEAETFFIVRAFNPLKPEEPNLYGRVLFCKGRSLLLKVQRPFALELYFYIIRFDNFSVCERAAINEVILQILRQRADTDFAGNPGDVKEQMNVEGTNGRSQPLFYQLRFRQRHRRASFWKGVQDRIKAHKHNSVWQDQGRPQAASGVNESTAYHVQLAKPSHVCFTATLWAEPR